MNRYYVGTIDIEPIVTQEEKELIENLKNDKQIQNRFPFDDLERNKVELYKIGSQKKCQEYINTMDESIQYLFKVYRYN